MHLDILARHTVDAVRSVVGSRRLDELTNAARNAVTGIVAPRNVDILPSNTKDAVACGCAAHSVDVLTKSTVNTLRLTRVVLVLPDHAIIAHNLTDYGLDLPQRTRHTRRRRTQGIATIVVVLPDRARNAPARTERARRRVLARRAIHAFGGGITVVVILPRDTLRA